MKESFVLQENETYNLRSGNHLARNNMQKAHYGIESVSSLGAKLWNLLQREFSSLFAKIKLENGLLKNVYASFVRHIQKLLVIFDFSQTLLDLPLYVF